MIKAGVDGVKIGIGPGAGCLTRVNTGAGVPQLSAVIECSEVARKYGKSSIADGGIKLPGAYAKAIGAGASAAMFGNLLAGTLESPSELIELDGVKYKYYSGSASKAARERRMKQDSNYKSKPSDFIEGAEGLTDYQGTVEELVDRFNMGLRSAMSYSGALNIEEFQKKVVFIPVTTIGYGENGAHGIKRTM